MHRELRGFFARTIIAVAAMMTVGFVAPMNASAETDDSALVSSTRDRSETKNTFKSDMDLKWRIQPLAIELSTRMYTEHEYWRSNHSMLFSEVFVRAGAVVNRSEERRVGKECRTRCMTVS